MTPDIVLRQVILDAHDLAPDGSFAIVARRVVEGDDYLAHLWIVPLAGGTGRGRRGGSARPGRPRQLTRGRVLDGSPRISPDGRSVAFTRCPVGVPDAATRLFVLPLDGGEPEPRSPEKGSVGELAWAPDGRSLAYTAEVEPPRFLVGKAKPGTSPLARHIRRMDWRWDEAGHVDRWSHLHVVAATGPVRPRRLTSGEGGAHGIAWRPDGRAIAYAADRRPDGDRSPHPVIWAVEPEARSGAGAGGTEGAGAGAEADADATGARAGAGGIPEPRELVRLAGPAGQPAYSPDGRWIAVVGADDPDWTDEVSPTLYVAPAGGGPAVALAPELDRPVGSWADSDLMGWFTEARGGPTWTEDGDVIALVSDRGRVHPWRFPVDPASGGPAGDPVRLAAGDVAGRSLAIGGGVVSMVAMTDHGPAELCVVEGGGAGVDDAGGGAGPGADGGGSRSGADEAGGPGDAGGGGPGRLRPRTTFGSAWARGLAWPTMRVVDAPGPGGPIETWVASPAGSGDGPLPTIVDVHGGPLGAWAPTPSLEVVLLCAAGYRVVLPNIRGSATYGADWIRPQLGHWGEVDADDVHAALDHVISLGLADADRLGVLGLSYGGFMVNWLVGTTDRFRAAVSENGVANQVSAWANSDCGPEYCRTALMGDPTTPEGIELLWRQSPLRHVANVRTPLLMLQGEADRRCPPADTEQLFIALRWLGREVEYVLYPDEYHVYASTGRPDRRIDRHTRMLAWFDAHLKG